MYLSRVRRTLPRLKKILNRQHSQVALVNQDEYTEAPEYPPILDMSSKGKKLRERQALHKKIQNINTVEEKQIALNMPFYYGWKCVMLNEDKIPYNAMPLVQYYTRSHLILGEKLPETYNEYAEAAEEIVKEIKPLIEEALVMENDGVMHTQSISLDKPEASQIENTVSKNVVKQINRIIMNNLSDKLPHILSTQVDFDPRHEAFWLIGHVDPPNSVVRKRCQISWLKGQRYEPVNRGVQYLGTPMLTLRNKLPLKPIIAFNEAENPEFKVPKFTNLPGSVGYFENHRHGTNIPGFWPGEFDEHGLLSYHGRGHILTRKESFGPEDNIEALHCQAMKASFGWLIAQANFQGFTTYNDMTYPLVTQTVITNGKLWSLYAYQLNTIVMHNDVVDSNPKSNICFGTKPMQLYDTIENGKVQGLNEDVLKTLVQFYLNAPEERDHDMKPYLGREEQVVADIEDDKKRCWLENTYKHLVSNRPRHNLLPEIYHWEQIYKIKFNTRFFERRVRPFALGIDPYKRRLDEHLPPYIPKALRPYPKARKRFEDTYYPKV